MKDAPLSYLGSCPFSLFPLSLSGVGVEKEEGEIANRGASLTLTTRSPRSHPSYYTVPGPPRTSPSGGGGYGYDPARHVGTARAPEGSLGGDFSAPTAHIAPARFRRPVAAAEAFGHV